MGKKEKCNLRKPPAVWKASKGVVTWPPPPSVLSNPPPLALQRNCPFFAVRRFFLQKGSTTLSKQRLSLFRPGGFERTPSGSVEDSPIQGTKAVLFWAETGPASTFPRIQVEIKRARNPTQGFLSVLRKFSWSRGLSPTLCKESLAVWVSCFPQVGETICQYPCYLKHFGGSRCPVYFAAYIRLYFADRLIDFANRLIDFFSFFFLVWS